MAIYPVQIPNRSTMYVEGTKGAITAKLKSLGYTKFTITFLNRSYNLEREAIFPEMAADTLYRDVTHFHIAQNLFRYME